jgi:DNA helicase II / ATP-dependent DNA helicase PcrA
MAPSLNPAQQKAVEAPQKPLLIVAGAGTGKTRTLTSRLLYLIGSGVPADSICALTFTNKAAKEMAERVEAELSKETGGRREPFIGTFHSLGARILRTEARFAGRKGSFVIYDADDSKSLIRRILKEMEVGKEEEGPSFFIHRISQLKNGEIVPEDLEISRNPQDRLTLRVYERYEEKLKENNAFDFDDLLTKVVAIFKKEPAILAKYEKRYPYLLVDEYQDINNTQYELIRLLARKTQQLSVVGDDQQTIYSWRGSNFEIFLNFEKDWPDSNVVVLDQNYRSSGNIIAAASAMISHNKKQKPKQLWTENEPGLPIRFVEAGGEDDEAQWVVNEIAGTERGSTAVLYRTNAQSRAIEQALIERGIPYQVYGGLKFYERREIKDVVAGLRVVLNPEDSVSAERLLKTFRKTKTAALYEALKGHEADPPATLIPLIIRATDYFTYLEKNFVNSSERKENIAELVYFASQFTDLSAFLEQITLLQATDTIRNARPGQVPVSLMTVHLAKGLEFERVFVIGATEGLLPHVRSLETDAEIEEERRLMYVAMTRARTELIITFYDLPSRFLSEIPAEYTKYESLISDDGFFRGSDDEERYITYD